MSTQSGRDEVYVRPFPEGGRRVQISNNGAVEPMWGADSTELFYREMEGAVSRMIAARLETDAELRVVRREELFSGAYFYMNNWARTVYDYDRENDRFLMVEFRRQAGEAFQVNVLVNWFDELRRQVPKGR